MNGYPHNVKVGDKLVVVDDSPFKSFHLNAQEETTYCPFVKGQVVTVVGLDVDIPNGVPIGPYFFISELSPFESTHHKRFKPLQKSKADISIFESILANPHKQLEAAS